MKKVIMAYREGKTDRDRFYSDRLPLALENIIAASHMQSTGDSGRMDEVMRKARELPEYKPETRIEKLAYNIGRYF